MVMIEGMYAEPGPPVSDLSHPPRPAAPPRQVKGLFCSLPRRSLEHTVVHGLGLDNRANKVFRDAWFQVRNESFKNTSV
jgi:hypothetical protein